MGLHDPPNATCVIGTRADTFPVCHHQRRAAHHAAQLDRPLQPRRELDEAGGWVALQGRDEGLELHVVVFQVRGGNEPEKGSALVPAVGRPGIPTVTRRELSIAKITVLRSSTS